MLCQVLADVQAVLSRKQKHCDFDPANERSKSSCFTTKKWHRHERSSRTLHRSWSMAARIVPFCWLHFPIVAASDDHVCFCGFLLVGHNFYPGLLRNQVFTYVFIDPGLIESIRITSVEHRRIEAKLFSGPGIFASARETRSGVKRNSFSGKERQTMPNIQKFSAKFTKFRRSD